MRNFVRLGAAVVTAAGLGLGFVSVANAAECPAGYGCIWQNNDYGGSYNWRSVNNGNFSLVNAASSAGANGGSCARTEFFDGAGETGSYFTLYSATLVGSNYQDPNLSNGVGFDGAGINWNDRVESYIFVGC